MLKSIYVNILNFDNTNNLYIKFEQQIRCTNK